MPGVDVDHVLLNAKLPKSREIEMEITPADFKLVLKQQQEWDEAVEDIKDKISCMSLRVQRRLSKRITLIEKRRFRRWQHPFKLPTLVKCKKKYFIKFVPQDELEIDFKDVPHPYEDLSKLEKTCGVAIGPIIENKPFIANYRSKYCMLAGGFKRVWHEQQYSRKEIKRFGVFVNNFIHSHYEPLEYMPLSHKLQDTWLDNSKYTIKQKEKFHKILQEYFDSGLTLHHYINDNDKLHSRIYECGTFIKKEFLTEEKFPRLINPRPDEFKAFVAPYIKEIEHRVIYNEHFIKGKLPNEVVDRMKEIQSKYLHLYETDFSSFEGSFSVEFQDVCERALFDYMLQFNPHIKSMVDECYTGRNVLILGATKDKITFKGSRMSGDMWTSLANGFSNMMIMQYCAMLSHKRVSDDFDFMVEGDDGLIGSNYAIDFGIVKKLGFSLKCVEACDTNDLSFCGHRYSPSGDHFVDAVAQLTKFGWAYETAVIDNYSENTTKYEAALMRAKALSLLVNAGGMPIVQPLCEQIILLTEGIKVERKHFDRWLDMQYDVSKLDHLTFRKDITKDNREYFANLYGVNITEQLKIEQEIREQTTLRFQIPLLL